MAARLRLDPIACDGFGWCAELLPERISLDEWGYPVLDGELLEGELLELARRVVGACPRRALSLVAASAAMSGTGTGAGRLGPARDAARPGVAAGAPSPAAAQRAGRALARTTSE